MEWYEHWHDDLSDVLPESVSWQRQPIIGVLTFFNNNTDNKNHYAFDTPMPMTLKRTSLVNNTPACDSQRDTHDPNSEKLRYQSVR